MCAKRCICYCTRSALCTRDGVFKRNLGIQGCFQQSVLTILSSSLRSAKENSHIARMVGLFISINPVTHSTGGSLARTTALLEPGLSTHSLGPRGLTRTELPYLWRMHWTAFLCSEYQHDSVFVCNTTSAHLSVKQRGGWEQSRVRESHLPLANKRVDAGFGNVHICVCVCNRKRQTQTERFRRSRWAFFSFGDKQELCSQFCNSGGAPPVCFYRAGTS